MAQSKVELPRPLLHPHLSGFAALWALTVSNVGEPSTAVEFGIRFTDLTSRGYCECVNALDLVLTRPNALSDPSPGNFSACEENVESLQDRDGRLGALSNDKGFLVGKRDSADL